MARYRVIRTATLRQYKYVEAPADALDEEVLEMAWTVEPWHTAKVIDTDHIEVEKADD